MIEWNDDKDARRRALIELEIGGVASAAESAELDVLHAERKAWIKEQADALPIEERIHTCCRDCVFAVYAPDKETKMRTQIDCATNQLNKYRTAGFELVEATDNEKNFFLVDKKVCPKRRTAKWKHATSSLQNQLREVENEVIVGFDVVIYLDANSTIEQFETTFQSALDTEYYRDLGKLNIIIIHNYATIPNSKLIQNLVDKKRITWTVETIREPNADMYRAIDIACMKMKKQFYTIYLAGATVNPDIFKNINQSINEDLRTPAIVLSDTDGVNGLTILRSLHNTLMGNRNGTILEKVTELELCDTGVMRVEELCKS